MPTRRQLLALLGAAAGGGVVVGVAQAVSAAGAGGVSMRTGRVVTYDRLLITVDVGSASFLGMPYLRSYRPLLGDNVICISQGGSWICLGPAAGSPSDNAVLNCSFEDSPIGAMATGWGIYHDPISIATSSATVENVYGSSTIDGMQTLRIKAHAAGGDPQFTSDWVYSSPIPVSEGDRWIAAAHAQRQDDTSSVTPASVAVGVLLSWYATEADVYPSTVAPDSVQSIVGIDNTADWTLIGAATDPDGVVVPTGANFMRVLLYSEILFPASFGVTAPLYWDLVIARQVG